MATEARQRRLNRAESQRRTRSELLESARRIFLARGFHGAGVAEIAAHAGYTTGAIYSNFGGKDELFLSLMDVELASRAESQRDAMEASDFEQMVRAAARDLYRAGARDPAMTPLIVEFWIYCSDKPHLRERVRALHERQIGWIAETLETATERFGLQLILPAHEVARGGGALSRGARLERLLDPGAVSEKTFEEMFTAYVRGLAMQTRDEPERTG